MDAAQGADIGAGVGRQGEDVGVLAHFQGAEVGAGAEHARAVYGRRAQRLQRRHARLYVVLRLTHRGAGAVVRFVGQLIGTQGDGDVLLNGHLQRLPVPLTDRVAPLQIPRRRTDTLEERRGGGLTDHDGRHQPGAGLAHLAQHRAIQGIAVLNAVDTGLYGDAGRRRGPRMRRDPGAEAMRSIDHRADLPGRHQRLGDVAAVRRDAPGDQNLDPRSAQTDLSPRGFNQLVGTVGVQRTGLGAVAAGDKQRLARREDARPVGFPTANRAVQGQIGVAAVSRRADRGHAGVENVARGGGHAQGQRGVAFMGEPRGHLAGQNQTQVHVHIHQPRDQPLSALIDDARALGNRRVRGGAERRDALALDDQHRVRARRPAVQIEQRGADQRRDPRARRRRHAEQQRKNTGQRRPAAYCCLPDSVCRCHEPFLWTSAVGVCHGRLPWAFPMDVCHGRSPWASAVGVSHGRLPWASAVSVCHGRLPWTFPMDVCRGRFPWTSAVDVSHEPLPGACYGRPCALAPPASQKR